MRKAHNTPPTPSSALVKQVGGTHYSKCSGVCPHCFKEIQHWDLYARMPYLEAQVARYVLRWQEKGAAQDLDKAMSCLVKLIELNKNSPLPTPSLE